jgi:hypothetical protein
MHSYQKGETPTRTPKRPRMEGNPPTEMVRAPKRPRMIKEQGPIRKL